MSKEPIMETPWFRGGVRPHYVGQYKTRNDPDSRGKRFIRLSGGSGFISRRWWDGQQWLQYEGGPPSIMGSVHHQWCGLTGKVK